VVDTNKTVAIPQQPIELALIELEDQMYNHIQTVKTIDLLITAYRRVLQKTIENKLSVIIQRIIPVKVMQVIIKHRK
jgi:hypothetical protein